MCFLGTQGLAPLYLGSLLLSDVMLLSRPPASDFSLNTSQLQLSQQFTFGVCPSKFFPLWFLKTGSGFVALATLEFIVDQVSLELASIALTLPHECWDYRYMPPRWALK